MAADINVAPSGTASQSSTRSAGGAALRGNDTLTTGSFGAGTNTHTNTAAAGQYWEVTLGPNATGLELSNITVFGRGDCCQNRLSNFTLDVYDSSNAVLFTQNYVNGSGIPASNGTQAYPGQGVRFTPPPGIFNADRVRITTNINDVFSLAEVQVNANNANIRVGGDGVIGATELDGALTGATSLPNARVVRVVQNRDATYLNLGEVQVFDNTNTNIAPSGTASQSSTYSGSFPASNAIDNNLSDFSHTQATSTAGGDQFWQVTLAADSTLDQISIYDRAGCCSDNRTADIQLQVFSDTAATNLIYDQHIAGLLSGAHSDVTFFEKSVATLDPAGQYTFEIDGDTLASDLLKVAQGNALGSTELVADGTLNVELLDGKLDVGDTFQILMADSFSGEFDQINLPGGANKWDTSNLLVNGTITAVPEPASIVLWSLLGLALCGYGYRRTRAKK